MNTDINRDKQEIDDAIKASTIAANITREVLMQEEGRSDELEDFMNSPQRELFKERLSKGVDDKSEILNDILTHDLTAKELQFKAILDKNKKKRILLRRIIATASAVAVISTVCFFVLENDGKQGAIVTISSQKSNVAIPTIITSQQQVIGISDNMKNIEEKISYVSVNEKVINYDVKNHSEEKNIETNKLIVPALFTQKLILQDGTEVTVNSCSELEYPIAFSGNSREVTLRGEAYFKVAKSDKPFIVKMNDSYVKVLGTEFNINARESEMIKTVLIEGSVAVAFRKSTVVMKPHEIAIINKKSNHIEVSPTDIYRHIAWLEGYSEFINEDFSDVMKELSSWYGVNFTYDDTDFKDTKLNLSIEKSLTILETFSKLKKAVNISIHLNKNGQYEIKRIKTFK